MWIPVPDDPGQIIYVWWDALANYVTALGYGADDELSYRDWWVNSGERVHVIGKGITRFHAVYWLALLLSAGQPLPSAIYVHEYLSAEGAKLSKSASNAVSPYDLAGRFGTDAVRWWLLREVARLGDTDFTAGRLVACANSDLANGLPVGSFWNARAWMRSCGPVSALTSTSRIRIRLPGLLQSSAWLSAILLAASRAIPNGPFMCLWSGL